MSRYARIHTTSQTITYHTLPSGIREMIFHESSRRAVDESIAYMHDYVATHSSHIMNLVLCDVRESGMLPMSYSTVQFQQFARQFPEYVANSKTAYLVAPTFFQKIIIRLINVLGMHHDHAFFTDRDKAVAWLLSASHE